MRLAFQDSRRFENDHSWGFGVFYYGWDDSAIDVSFGFRSLSISWRRNRPAAQGVIDRLRRFLMDPVWGFGIHRDLDEDKKWMLSIGPWMHEFGAASRPSEGER